MFSKRHNLYITVALFKKYISMYLFNLTRYEPSSYSAQSVRALATKPRLASLLIILYSLSEINIGKPKVRKKKKYYSTILRELYIHIALSQFLFFKHLCLFFWSFSLHSEKNIRIAIVGRMISMERAI
jgi:hypothetical protein